MDSMVRPIKRLLRLLRGLCEMYSKILLRELKRRSLDATGLGNSDARAEVRLACHSRRCQLSKPLLETSVQLRRVSNSTLVDEAIPTQFGWFPFWTHQYRNSAHFNAIMPSRFVELLQLCGLDRPATSETPQHPLILSVATMVDKQLRVEYKDVDRNIGAR
jgi:hypothetical protein